jgi:minor histocompatibility antigen H13
VPICLIRRLTNSCPIASSPACILSFFTTAIARGELKSAWNWSDEPEKPLESADTGLVDIKSSGNGSATGSADVQEVEEKVGTDLDASEAESKPKKKRSKKKTT